MGKVVRTEFGTVLRRFRLKCGLTQQAVADALHVHRATYSYYESGKTLPNFQQLGRIAKVFGVSRETLSAYLEHPEQSADWRLPQRAPKRVAENPGCLGKLQPDEKSLIALYRLCGEQHQKVVWEFVHQLAAKAPS